jgi:hypothetical protein
MAQFSPSSGIEVARAHHLCFLTGALDTDRSGLSASFPHPLHRAVPAFNGCPHDAQNPTLVNKAPPFSP